VVRLASNDAKPKSELAETLAETDTATVESTLLPCMSQTPVVVALVKLLSDPSTELMDASNSHRPTHIPVKGTTTGPTGSSGQQQWCVADKKEFPHLTIAPEATASGLNVLHGL